MRILVPSSSANLGPGFDCFGIAWQSRNEIFFEHSDTLSIEGCAVEYANSVNLAWLGFSKAMQLAGKKAAGVKIIFGKTDIPICRGLGSSAALCAAGAAAADALFNLGLGRQGILDAATAVEGHPDNVAPAIFGGLTASMMDGERAVTVNFPIHERLRFTALIPDFQLSTAMARAVLPKSVNRADAIFNVSRGALLLNALGSGDLELLSIAMDDRLHQPYRWELISGSEAARKIAKECGAAALCISGAGPTLLCVTGEDGFAERTREALAIELPGWEVRELQVDREGVRIEKSTVDN